MNQYKIFLVLWLSLLILSCGNKDQKQVDENKDSVEFDDDLTIEQPTTRIPGAIEQMNYPEFDYSDVIERFKRGERIGAADLIDNYAAELNVIRQDLEGEQKAAIRIIIDDMKLVARQVRSKKITDVDDLLSECMIIDRSIGEVFIEEDS